MKFTQKATAGILTISLATIAISLLGCGAPGYRDPVARFQSASSVVVASTRLYITELNKNERNHYIENRLSARAQIKLNELEAVQVFSRDGLRARLDALLQLASYGNLLLKLADGAASEKTRAEARNLGDAIKKLSASVGALTDTDDHAFSAAVRPVAAVVGEILDLILQQKAKEALDKAITAGEVPINNLIATLRNDIAIAYERKRSSLSEMRTTLVDEYNREMLKGSETDPEKLRMYAERIRDHEDRWEAFASADPGDGLDAVGRAHAALVTYAKSNHGISDLASLVDAMEAFAARATNIGQAVQALIGK